MPLKFPLKFPRRFPDRDIARVGSVPQTSVSSWTPAALGSSLKLWLRGSDASLLFKDADGTIPVTAANDAVGLAVDQIHRARILHKQPQHGSRYMSRMYKTDSGVVRFVASDKLTNTDNALWHFMHDGTDYAIFVVGKPGAVADPELLLLYRQQLGK